MIISVNARKIFTQEQIENLKKEFGKVASASVDSLPKFHKLLGGMTDSQVEQVSGAGIKFLSKLAINELIHRGLYGMERMTAEQGRQAIREIISESKAL